MAKKNIIVLGASAGGVDALKQLAGNLPADFSGSLLIVLHVGADGKNLLPELLSRVGPLPAKLAVDKETIKPGQIYIAVGGRHMLVGPGGRIRLSHGPKENHCRPAIDPLFRSAALIFGSRAVGVVLTGNLDDGTAGLWAVKNRGGTTIIQDPQEAFAPSMPTSALKYVNIDHVTGLAALPSLLVRLCREDAETTELGNSQDMEIEVKIAASESSSGSALPHVGELSPFACPECHGVMAEIKEGGIRRYRCHTGHAYSMETLLHEFDTKTEEILWNAVRAMEEKLTLLEVQGQEIAPELYQREIEKKRLMVEAIRNFALRQASVDLS